MFCINCGEKLNEEDKFCTKCGNTVSQFSHKEAAQKIEKAELPDNEKWWTRLFRVLYIAAYLPLLVIIPVVWSANNYSYYRDTFGKAFFWTLFVVVIYLSIIRLIKIAILYVTTGCKPKWQEEFKKLF